MVENNKKCENLSIDEDLYSRQIISFGMETMEKISKLKILIIGLRGLGIEIAKDIIISGPKQVTIFDPNKVRLQDLGSNFYLNEKDIGRRRDESCISNLQKLNKYVQIEYLKEISDINDIDKISDVLINNFNVLIITEIISKKNIFFLDEICRKNRICLIYSAIFGLTSFIFTDFGPDFIISDEYGINKRKFAIKKIERSEKGTVEIDWPDKKKTDKLRNFIIFKDVQGMKEINYSENNKKIFKIEKESETKFYIGNTLNFSEYKSGGYIEEIEEPINMNYESFKEKLEDPFDLEADEINNKKKFIFLVFRSLMIFFDIKGRLPLIHDETDYEEVKSITRNICDNLKFDNLKSFQKDEIIFDENIIRNICFTSTAEISCMTSFIGGVVCQEIIKTTGKFTPINQFAIFDFLEYSTLIPDSYKKFNDKNNSRYDELISIFGDNVVSKIQNLNILLAGSGALGCELLKNIALFGISNSVLLIDDDKIEISNLNRQFLFHENHKGLSKAEVACNAAKEINKDIKCNYLNKRISPKNKDIFNKNYFNNVDFVLGAIDSQDGNYYLVKQCELYQKIFIKGGTNKAAGKSEIFIPNETCSFNDIEFIEEEEEKIPSCTRREFPKKIEDCIDNARDLFDEYFKTLIIDMQSFITDKNINKQKLILEIESSKNKFNLMHIIFNLLNIDNVNDIEIQMVKFCLNEYYKLFFEDIQNIYKSHPFDETEESKSFWSDKKIPSEIYLDIENKLCLDFLFYFVKIFSKLLCLDISITNDINSFKEKINGIFLETDKKNLNKYESIKDTKILLDIFLSEKNEYLNNVKLLEKLTNLKPILFEKDIPELGHIEFIHSVANLKAKSYNIPSCDKFYTLKYSGKIAPTIISSTTIVSGFMCFQIIGFIINQLFFMDDNKHLINLANRDEELEEELQNNGLHNLCFNLVKNDFTLEPLYDQIYTGNWEVNELLPNKYSRWFKIEENGNKTIEEFIDYMNNKYQVYITLILSAEDDRQLFERIKVKKKSKLLIKKIKQMEEKKNLQLKDLYFQTSKEICNDYNKNNDIFLKIKDFDNNNNYIEFPVVVIKN